MLLTEVIDNILTSDVKEASEPRRQLKQELELLKEKTSNLNFWDLATLYNLLTSFVGEFGEIYKEEIIKLDKIAQDLADNIIEPSVEVFLAQSKCDRQIFLNILSAQNQRPISEEEYVTYGKAKQKFIETATSLSQKLQLEAKFMTLKKQWLKETYTVSSTTVLANHPAYQEIIALGEPVIPLLLRELETNPAQWFMALKAISQENPVSPDLKGKTQQMTNAWLQWGHDKGYKW